MAAVGGIAPGFVLDGFSLRELTYPVLLVFFKISCPTCQLALPYLQRLADEGGLRVVAISQDDPEGTAEFQEAFGTRMEVVFDNAANGYAVSNAYGITTVPAMFLVEPGGRIAWLNEGFVKADLAALALRWGVDLFPSGDRAPEWKPGCGSWN
ncbi:MAG TPA: TlpA disulfide reductase family protein [Bryobacteraceae bacterium]|nr:TlpA disulfide reductase family protein [Bryobacteraceae bacterium]